jgi:hypothetical protein
MNDDWRLRIDVQEEGRAHALTERLDGEQLEHDLSDAFHDRVVVSRNGARVFLYSGTREQAELARDAIEADARKHDWTVDIDFRHWHPTAEDWEDPDKPLPEDDAAKLSEHQALMSRELEETAWSGHPEFEVRVDLSSRHEAVRFSEQLRKEGLPAVHRWKFLLVGAADEDMAKELAERIRGEAPPGSQVHVEGTWAAAYAERPPNPFAVLGGLGG